MAVKVYNLEDDVEEEFFSLIAIHSGIEGYRLAYLLNKALNLNLVRDEFDIKNRDSAEFPLFEWDDEKQFQTWTLVPNHSDVTSHSIEVKQGTLFDVNSIETKKYYLVPQYKKVNFFLKINSTCTPEKEKEILAAILSVSKVTIAFIINTEAKEFKSKKKLIFS